MTDKINRKKPKIVLSLDVGTTTIRAIAIDERGNALGRSNAKVSHWGSSTILLQTFDE